MIVGVWCEMMENESLGTKQITGLRIAVPLTGYVKSSRKHKDLHGTSTRNAGRGKLC